MHDELLHADQYSTCRSCGWGSSRHTWVGEVHSSQLCGGQSWCTHVATGLHGLQQVEQRLCMSWQHTVPAPHQARRRPSDKAAGCC
jgi:hypothetical protein